MAPHVSLHTSVLNTSVLKVADTTVDLISEPTFEVFIGPRNGM